MSASQSQTDSAQSPLGVAMAKVSFFLSRWLETVPDDRKRETLKLVDCILGADKSILQFASYLRDFTKDLNDDDSYIRNQVWHMCGQAQAKLNDDEDEYYDSSEDAEESDQYSDQYGGPNNKNGPFIPATGEKRETDMCVRFDMESGTAAVVELRNNYHDLLRNRGEIRTRTTGRQLVHVTISKFDVLNISNYFFEIMLSGVVARTTRIIRNMRDVDNPMAANTPAFRAAHSREVFAGLKVPRLLNELRLDVCAARSGIYDSTLKRLQYQIALVEMGRHWHLMQAELRMESRDGDELRAFFDIKVVKEGEVLDIKPMREETIRYLGLTRKTVGDLLRLSRVHVSLVESLGPGALMFSTDDVFGIGRVIPGSLVVSEVVRLLVVADKDGHLRRAANALAWLVVEPIWEGKSFKWDLSDARL